MGVTQHCGGSDTSTSICNLLLATGNLCGRGRGRIRCAGITMCRARATSGRCRMCFRGIRRWTIRRFAAKFEADWGVTLPITTGLDNRQMIDAIHEGKLKSMYIKGEDTITSDCECE